MADRIKGITVEIGGDTTGLNKALESTNKNIKNTQEQLKDVEKLLKLDPTNTELLAQKQKLLGDQINDTKEKLNTLKEAEKQAQEQFQKGEISEQQYNALKREIIATESELKSLGSAADTVKTKMSAISQVASSVASGANKIASATKGISTAAIGLVAALGANAYSVLTKADDWLTTSAQSGFSTTELQKMEYASDMIDVASDTIISAVRKLKKNMTSTSTDVADAWEQLGVSIYDTSGEMRDIQDIFYEVVKALSNVKNETERDTLAMTLFGKSADELAGIIDDGGEALQYYGDQAEELGLIMSEDVVASLGAANDQVDILKNELEAALGVLGAKTVEELAPTIEGLTEDATKLVEALGELDPDTLKLVIEILLGLSIISPVAKGIGTIATGIKAIAEFLPTIGTALKTIVSFLPTIGTKITSIFSKFSSFFSSVSSFFSSAAGTALLKTLGITGTTLAIISGTKIETGNVESDDYVAPDGSTYQDYLNRVNGTNTTTSSGTISGTSTNLGNAITQSTLTGEQIEVNISFEGDLASVGEALAPSIAVANKRIYGSSGGHYTED